MLLSSCELERLHSCLNETEFFRGYQLSWVEETRSTNDDLKKDWAHEPFRPAILVAEHQTAGRGQYQRQWLDRHSSCLMFSFSSEADPEGFPPSLLAGVALFDAIKGDNETLPPGLWLKWPNDLWSGRGKLAGILTESCFCGAKLRVVTGIGVNIRPLDCAGVDSACVADFARNLEHAALLQRFLCAYDKVQRLPVERLCELWTSFASSFWKTRFVVSESGCTDYIAVPEEIRPDGGLVLQTENGLRKIVVSASLKPLF